MTRLTIIEGDALERLRELTEGSVHCCVTSPPYWGLRDYGVECQIGLEPTPDEWVARLVEVFREVRRVLRKDGVLFVNCGDAFASTSGANSGGLGRRCDGGQDRIRQSGLPATIGPGLKPKDLIGLPWMLAFALRADGWYLRSDIIWAKPAPMPESVTDRCTKSHEHIFMLSKSARYWYDAQAIAENGNSANYRANPSVRAVPPGQTRQGKMDERRGEVSCATRNKRDVWTINSQPFAEAHFATYPEELPRTCIMAACPERCCAACGGGWARVVDRKAMVIARSDRTHDRGRTRASGTMLEPPSIATLGFRPSCECGTEETVPGVCLDPFLGSGTTALAALKCGRRAIGIELNPEYAEMAHRRCAPILAQGALEL